MGTLSLDQKTPLEDPAAIRLDKQLTITPWRPLPRVNLKVRPTQAVSWKRAVCHDSGYPTRS